MPLPVCLCVAGCVILCTLTISFISSSCRRHRRRQHHPHHRLSLGLLDYTKHFSKGDDDEPSGTWKKRKKKKGCVTFFCSLFVHQTKKVTLSFPQLKHDLQISSICLVFLTFKNHFDLSYSVKECFSYLCAPVRVYLTIGANCRLTAVVGEQREQGRFQY